MTKIKTLKGLNRNVKMYLKQIYPDPLIGLKKYADTTTSIGPGLDKNGFPVTGLTEDFVENGKTIEGTRKAMEKLLDLAPGTLKHTNVDYWAKFFVRVSSDRVELDLSDSMDLLKYLFVSAQSIVALGQKQITTNSRFEYVLYSEEQEAQIRVENRKVLKTAYRLSDDLDLETKINILSVYGEIADATQPNSIIDAIDEKIEENPEKFLAIAQDQNLVFKSVVTKALDRGVFSLKDGAVYHKDVLVGYTQDEAANAISKDKRLEAVIRAEISGDMELIQEVMSKAKAKK